MATLRRSGESCVMSMTCAQLCRREAWPEEMERGAWEEQKDTDL